MTGSARPRVLLRFWSPLQVLWNVGAGLLFVVIVAGRALEHGHVEVGGLPFGVAGALLALRALRLRVLLTDTELVVRSWWRTRRFAREDIVDLRPVAYDGAWVRASPSPIWSQLRLSTRDGREHALRAVITVRATGKARAFCDTVMGRPHRPRRPARHATGRSSR